MKVFICIISMLLCFFHIAAASEIQDEQDLVFGDGLAGNLSNDEDSGPSFFSSFFLDPLRVSLGHEVSYKFEEPKDIKNNRSYLRLEYSKFFLNYFYLQFDTKGTVFWKNDHRTEAVAEYDDWENDNDTYYYKDLLFENNIREAFLQASFADTSIKAGIQVLIWGESDAGAITDVISPRDYSDIFFVSLEDARIGQPMVTLDQFSPIGTWSLFFIPDPDFNKSAEEGTAYYYDPFNGNATYRDDPEDKNLFECGMRWKKTFGKSDISIMAASLIDNDYVYRMEGTDAYGKTIITEIKQRYSLAGMTFNYAIGSFMVRGEVGYKSPQAYNNAAFQVIEKDGVDSSLKLEYSSGGTFSIGLEAVNKHIIGWSDEIVGIPQNSNSLVLTIGDKFFNEDLSIDWMTTYNEPYTGFLHYVTTSYQWNDNLTFYCNAYFPTTKNKKSDYWVYRDQKQVVFKTQIQF